MGTCVLCACVGAHESLTSSARLWKIVDMANTVLLSSKAAANVLQSRSNLFACKTYKEMRLTTEAMQCISMVTPHYFFVAAPNWKMLVSRFEKKN